MTADGFIINRMLTEFPTWITCHGIGLPIQVLFMPKKFYLYFTEGKTEPSCGWYYFVEFLE